MNRGLMQVVSYGVLLMMWGCASEPVSSACSFASDCPLGNSCVDGRCVPQLDAGPPTMMDAAPFDAGPGRDASPSPMEDVACRAVVSEAEQIQRPADVILLIDSSGSMGPSRDRIAEVINSSFDSILNASGIDYRVIVITETSRLMIGGALAAYDPPRMFSADIGTGSGSGANFTVLLDNYDAPIGSAPSWSSYLRPEAAKIWLHFTDSQGDGTMIDNYDDHFDDVLYAMHPEQFGNSVADRKLIYHAIVGLAPNTPPESPWEATAPVVETACNGEGFSPRPGPGYQELAIRTNGLRFPVCYYEGYGNVFSRIADDVIDTTSVSCSFQIPEPPVGETLDLATVAVKYTPGDGSEDIFLQTNMATCDDHSFVIDQAMGLVELCPQACAVVEANPDPAARIDIAFGCDPQLL